MSEPPLDPERNLTAMINPKNDIMAPTMKGAPGK